MMTLIATTSSLLPPTPTGTVVCTGWVRPHAKLVLGPFFGKGESHGMCAQCVTDMAREMEEETKHDAYLTDLLDPRD